MPHGAPHPDDLTRIAAVLERMTQQLDRTDATHAGISRTLARFATQMERQTAVMVAGTVVLERLQTTLERWLAEHRNGR